MEALGDLRGITYEITARVEYQPVAKDELLSDGQIGLSVRSSWRRRAQVWAHRWES
jgi:hypothetical protein